MLLRDVRVVARPTIFVSRTNSNTLVRFEATDTNAAAGRLRIFDSSGPAIGTAGMLRSGNSLHGEFWLRLDRPRSLVTELVLPGQAQPLRTTHRLSQSKRWKIYWLLGMTLRDVELRLSGLGSLRTMQGIAELRTLEARINPMPETIEVAGDEWDAMIAFREVERRATELAMELSNAPLVPNVDSVPSTLPDLINAAGYGYVSIGSTTGLISLAGTASTIPALGSDVMAGPTAPSVAQLAIQLESAARDLELSGEDRDYLVLMDAAGGDTGGKRRLAEAWNAEYESPTIEFDPRDVTDPPAQRTLQLTTRPERVPDAVTTAQFGLRRSTLHSGPANDLQNSLAAALDAASVSDAMQSIATAVPGTMIFNSSPFARTEYVETDRGKLLASDIPPNGYAFFPDLERPAPIDRGESLTIGTSAIELSLDPDTGSISSVTNRTDRNEWVGDGALNVIPYSSLLDARAYTLPGIGAELKYERWSSERGQIFTTVRAYDALPHVDIVNEYEDIGRRAMSTEFTPHFSPSHVAWELPLGYEEQRLPLRSVRFGRWTAALDGSLEDAQSALVINAELATHVECESGTLALRGPAGRQRFRMHFISGYVLNRQLFETGRSFDPMPSWRLDGKGSVIVPSYGSLLSLDRGEVVIGRIRPGPEPRSLDVFLRDLHRNGGPVSISGGAVAYDSWTPLLATGLPLGTEPPQTGVARIEIPPGGLAAIRLHGAELR